MREERSRTSDRRTQIIEAATAVMSQRGYSQTSMKQIAAEVGVAQGLLHYYFSSKEELLVEVVAHVDAEFEREWRDAIRDLDDPLARMSAAMNRVAEMTVERRGYWRLVFELYALGLQNEAIRKRYLQLHTQVVSGVVAEVEAVDARLTSRSPIAAHDLGSAVVAAIWGTAQFAITEKLSDPYPLFRALKAMLLSYGAMSYVASGKPPPLEELARLLDDQPAPTRRRRRR